MWTFILVAIIDSMAPDILQQFKDKNISLFNRRNKQLYALVFYVSIVVSVLFCIFGRFIIRILYGEAYLPAAGPLYAATWLVAFAYLGSARNAWIISYHQQKYLKYIYALAAALNIGLNCLFIPFWGATGAAVASLVTEIGTSIFFPLLFKPFRANIQLMWEAVSFRFAK